MNWLLISENAAGSKRGPEGEGACESKEGGGRVAAMNICNPPSAPVRVQLGSVHHCTYVITLLCPPPAAPAALDAVMNKTKSCLPALWQGRCGGTNSGCGDAINSRSVSLSALTHQRITSLTVSVCETQGWVCAGRTRRSLSAVALQPVSASFASAKVVDEDSTSTAATECKLDDIVVGVEERNTECDWVEVRYELRLSLVPVALGLVPLPPLMVSALYILVTCAVNCILIYIFIML